MRGFVKPAVFRDMEGPTGGASSRRHETRVGPSFPLGEARDRAPGFCFAARNTL
jgi:hypothetical protein